ncbi:MAG TPA: hypothetical protein VF681_05795 [Abditibacteriaceae bacterium]
MTYKERMAARGIIIGEAITRTTDMTPAQRDDARREEIAAGFDSVDEGNDE